MNDLVFLDTESTGLEVGVHQVWEIAYAVNDGPVNVFQVFHNLENADLQALKINGYLDRVQHHFYDPHHENRPRAPFVDVTLSETHLYQALKDNHLVASNPDFDSRMLSWRWDGRRPWHHRMIDLAPMGMLYFGWDRPKGLKDIADALRDRGFQSIPHPDHTAKRDVETLRACFYALTGGTDE